MVEDGGIAHDSIDDCDSTSAVDSNIESDLRVVDGDSLEIPSPVPCHLDSNVGPVDGDIADGKLLISNIDADVSTVDDEITHKTTTENPV